MGENSKISWTDSTFNPWRGCTRVSEGCRFCYAETMSKRNPGVLGVWGPGGTRVVASELKWAEVPRWNKWAENHGEPHRVFCASLADVFEDWSGPMVNAGGRRLWVSDEEPRRYCPEPANGLDGLLPDERANVDAGRFRPLTMDDVRTRLFNLIHWTPALDWLLLTKRPDRLYQTWTQTAWPLRCPNAWLGTTVENRAALDRISVLRRAPAAVRFLSIEPLLEDLGEINLDGIGWVIAGCESGPGARPMDEDWIRAIRDQCVAANIPFFYKQKLERGRKVETPELDGRQWIEMPTPTGAPTR